MGSRPLTYLDAARLLGVADNPLLRVFSAGSGAAAAAVTVASAGSTDFFALRGEVIRWGNTAVNGLRERITGVRRFDRTQRLVAAHSIIVVTSFFEAVDAVIAGHHEVDLAAARITAGEQVALATSSAAPRGYAELVQVLVDTPPPMPAPHRPFENTLAELEAYYGLAVTALGHFLSGLDAFEDRADRVAGALTAVTADLAGEAIRAYTEAYRALIAQAPEFGAWAGMVESQATRVVLGDAVAELAVQLREVRAASGAAAVDAALGGLGKRYRTALNRAILVSSQAPAHVVMPTLNAGYINPHCQVAVAGPSDLPATETWWKNANFVGDLQGFVLAHLTGPDAVTGPLVVLGQPGSGKSVMTRILAARLSDADYLVVRVELRSVTADSSIQSQIEQALLQMLGENVSWPRLARGAGATLPVVILDGFDELLQATGMNRADYLDQIQQFQQREQELDRPVAVLVTSRTVVADRARFPEGSVVLRLDSFDESQVRAWVDVWNAANAAGLAARGLRPLEADVVLAHGELAGQPLLLLLLALYDAGDNALQAAAADMQRVDLYERLFTDFVEREVDKHEHGETADQRGELIQAEWRRLSAVALAVLNRGGDVILDAELDRDIPHLLAEADLCLPTADSAHRPLTASQLMVGRFFFIHESSVIRDTGGQERSFEFLHATFGDFLAARQIVASLLDVAEERIHQQRRRGTFEPGALYSVTSFVTVTRRAPLWDFCRGLLAQLDARQRGICRELALELLPEAGYPHPTWSRADYQPRRVASAGRHAAFSANLVCFAVALSDGPVDAVALVGEPVVDNWRRQALLWQSQLDAEDRRQIWQALRVEWRLDSDPTRLEVRLEDGADIGVYESLPWPPDMRPITTRPEALRESMAPDVSVAADSRLGRSLRRSAFVQTAYEVRECLYDLMPYWGAFGTPGLHVIDDEPFLVSEAALFLQLLLVPATEQRDDVRGRQYGWALSLITAHRQRDLLIRQLVDDGPRLSTAALTGIFGTLRASDLHRNYHQVLELLAAVAGRTGEATLLGDLMRAVRWDFADDPDDPVKQRLIQLYRAFGLPDPFDLTDDRTNGGPSA